MKKFIVFLVTAVVLCAGATYFTAQQFQQQVLELEAKVQANHNMQLLDQQMSSGWLGASGQHVIAMTIEQPELQLVFTLPWQASYFPGWVNLTADLKIERDNGQQLENLVQAVGLTGIPLTGRADLNKIVVDYQLDTLTNNNQTQLAVKDLNVKTTFYYSGEQRNALILKHLSIEDSTTAIHVHDVRVQAAQQGEYPWMKGEWHYKVDKIEVHKAKERTGLIFEKGQFNIDYELKPERLYWHNQMSFDALGVTKMGVALWAVEKANLAGSLTSKEGQYLGDILLELSDISTQSAHTMIQPEEIAAKIRQAITQGKPRFELEDLSFKIDQPIKMQPKADGWAEFDTQVPFSIMHAEQQLRAELNLNNLPAELFLMLGLPLDYVTADGNYQVTINNGMLYFNGEPLLPL